MGEDGAKKVWESSVGGQDTEADSIPARLQVHALEGHLPGGGWWRRLGENGPRPDRRGEDKSGDEESPERQTGGMKGRHGHRSFGRGTPTIGKESVG